MKEITDKYAKRLKRYYTRTNNLETEIKELQGKLERLNCPSWIDEIIKPIAELLVKKMKNRYYEILGPFGMCSTTSIHFYINGNKNQLENCRSINFRPVDLEIGKIEIVDYDNNTNEYKKGTIGEVNGMNYRTIPMPDTIYKLLEYVPLK